MNELLKRSIFGLLYVLIVIFALQSFEGAGFLFLVFMLIGLSEFSKLTNLHFSTILLPSIFVFLAFFLFYYENGIIDLKLIQITLAFVLITLFVPLIFFIFDKISKDMLGNFYLAMVYLALPFSLAMGIPLKLLLAVFVIIWASDTFAYLTGKYFGKHKLAEKISPKKTIEGFVGGLVGSLIVGFAYYKYIGIGVELSVGMFIFLTVIIVIAGTLGDLLESRFKRLAGVKDSGTLIPGHGGVLDRLDSFILAVPFVFIFLLLI